MKESMRKTTAFICALALTAAPLMFNTYALPTFAEETVTSQPLTGSAEVTWEQIEENIIGSWVMAEKDGQAALTNEKQTFTVVSTTEAYSSVSRVDDSRSPWHALSQCDISIEGNVVTITVQTERNITIEHQFTITEISSDHFTAEMKFTRSYENAEPIVKENTVTFVKVDDLSEAVLGTWEGKCTSESSVFDDGKEHRWEYKPDDTYVYYNKIDESG